MKKKLSIITICFNSESSIARTLSSVCTQKNSEVEYIIIDGNSNDKTIEIVNSFEDKIDKIISEKDKGIYDAYNKGILNSTGEYIMFLNSDDWLAESSVNTILECLKSENEIYCSSINIFDEKQNLLYKKKAKRKLVPYWLMQPYSFPTLVIRRSLIAEMGGFDTSFATIADYDLILRIIKKKIKFMEIEKPTVNFSRGGISDYGDDYMQRKNLFKKHNLGLFKLLCNVFVNKLFKFKNWLNDY